MLDQFDIMRMNLDFQHLKSFCLPGNQEKKHKSDKSMYDVSACSRFQIRLK